MKIKESLARTREPGAWVLLVVVFAAITAGIVRLLLSGEASFGEATPLATRAFDAAGFFLEPGVTVAPGVAVLLAAAAGRPLVRARLIAVVALLGASIAALFGLITWMVSFVADVPGAFKVPEVIFHLAGLSLLTVGIMVAVAALRAEELAPARPPQPHVYGQHAYGQAGQQYAAYGYGQPGQPHQWYGQPQYQQYGQVQQHPYPYAQGQREQYQQPYGEHSPYGEHAPCGEQRSQPCYGQPMPSHEPHQDGQPAYEQPAYREPYEQQHAPQQYRGYGAQPHVGGPYGFQPYQQPDQQSHEQHSHEYPYDQPAERPVEEQRSEATEQGSSQDSQGDRQRWYGQPPPQ